MNIIENLHHLDQDISLAINSLHSPCIDKLMQFMSNKEVWIPLYLIVAIILFRRLGWRRAIISIIAIILTIIACDQFSNLIKDSVARLRPCYSTYMLENKLHMLESRWDYYGFFSAHAANSCGFAASSFYLLSADKINKYNGYGIGISIWAFMVSFSRVFAGKHYFGDVIVGIIIGISFGLLISIFARHLINRFNIL